MGAAFITVSNNCFITSKPEVKNKRNVLPAAPLLRVATPVRKAKMSSASIFLRENNSVNSPTEKKLTSRSLQLLLSASVTVSCAAAGSAGVGNRYTATTVNSAEMTTKSRKVNDIARIIRPTFECCSTEAMELATAKNTSGTTLTNNRFRKMSPMGFRYVTVSGTKMPMKLPVMMPASSSRIPE